VRLMRIHVEGLPGDITPDQVRVVFLQYGSVSDTQIIPDKYDRTKSAGFVEMPDSEGALAVRALCGVRFLGRYLNVREVR
jgi:RNA recognition motif-containing protein